MAFAPESVKQGFCLPKTLVLLIYISRQPGYRHQTSQLYIIETVAKGSQMQNLFRVRDGMLWLMVDLNL